MALFDFRDPAQAMADLLDREREAILEGRLDRLERILAEKERLTARLVPGVVDAPGIASLRRKAELNARLLDSMRVGLNDAGARLEAIRCAPRNLKTYDASGRRTVLGQGPSVKRAR